MMGPVGFTEYLKISFGEYLDKLMVWGLMVEVWGLHLFCTCAPHCSDNFLEQKRLF